MTDVVDVKTRSRMMSGIRCRNTRPEMLIRIRLHKNGFRYRLHDKKLAGKPDIILKKYRAVIFIHGCFWHKHECHLFKWPKTRPEFWRDKINGNFSNDQKTVAALKSSGWRVCIVWECALKGKKANLDTAIAKITAWLAGAESSLELAG